jgi:protein gp37
MKNQSLIQWTNFTGGPYLGCSPVSPGCVNCYAWDLVEARLWPILRRAYKLAGFADWETRPVWGDQATRVLTKGFWRDAIRVNKQAAARGERVKWFPSMIDWLDTMPAGIIDQDGNRLDPIAVLADFLDLIRRTPNIDWLLLTKRPENWTDLFMQILHRRSKAASKGGSGTLVTDPFEKWIINWVLRQKGPSNVWIGATCENQDYANKRIPALLKIPAICRFISYEPALGPIDFTDIVRSLDQLGGEHHFNALDLDGDNPEDDEDFHGATIDWIIVGGESGPKARHFNIEWARSTVAQCKDAGVPCFVKQLGDFPIATDFSPAKTAGLELILNQACDNRALIKLRAAKGGDESEWPADLRVRQFPTPIWNLKSAI